MRARAARTPYLGTRRSQEASSAGPDGEGEDGVLAAVQGQETRNCEETGKGQSRLCQDYDDQDETGYDDTQTSRALKKYTQHIAQGFNLPEPSKIHAKASLPEEIVLSLYTGLRS